MLKIFAITAILSFALAASAEAGILTDALIYFGIIPAAPATHTHTAGSSLPPAPVPQAPKHHVHTA